MDWVERKKAESSLNVLVRITNSELPVENMTLELPGGKTLTIEVHEKELWLVLGKPGGHWERVVKRLKIQEKILEVTWGDKEGEILVKIAGENQGPRFKLLVIPHSWVKYIGALAVSWVHRIPLQIIHSPTDYTELDSLDIGWRKAFGKDLCKDLRKALWKEGGLKALFRFRITQIKEKWGYLHFYYSGGGEKVQKVISRYEEISKRTCVGCGKPATWRTTSWICPWCDDCVEGNAERIEEDGNQE